MSTNQVSPETAQTTDPVYDPHTSKEKSFGGVKITGQPRAPYQTPRREALWPAVIARKAFVLPRHDVTVLAAAIAIDRLGEPRQDVLEGKIMVHGEYRNGYYYFVFQNLRFKTMGRFHVRIAVCARTQNNGSIPIGHADTSLITVSF
jgi:hypothetical protein